MTRMKDLHHYEQKIRWGWMIWPFVAVLIACFLVISVDALSIDDVNDSVGEAHYGSLPSGVIQLAPASYLVDFKADVTPLDICKGATTEGSGAKITKRFPEIGKIYVECYVEQKWNFGRKDDPSLGDGYVIAAQKQPFLIIFGIAAGLSLIYPLFNLFYEGFGLLNDGRKARKERKQNYHKLTARYAAIQSAYARDEIDDLQLDKKLKELVAEGYEIPDKEVFT
jgi:hypothetical protein